MVAWAYRSQSVRRSSKFPKVNFPGYVCYPGSLRERDAASQAILPTSLRALTSLEAAAAFTAGAFILPGSYIISAGDVSGDFLGWDYIHISERENKQAFPKRSLQRLVPSGNQGYIHNLGRSLSRELHCARNATGNALRDKSWSTCEINPRCNWDVRVGDMNQEAIKPAQTKLSLAFCVFTSALCEIVCPIWCCLSLLYKENRNGEQATTSF